MILSLAVALGINLWGVFVLYLPINFLIPEGLIEKVRTYLMEKFPWLNDHFQQIKEANVAEEGSQLTLLASKESRDKAISSLIETYEYDYLFVFLLAVLPIPFLGTIMTGGAIFAVKTLEIRYGLFVIIVAKITKVFALAAVAYFAHYL
ncbi:MAG: hypothetical protein ACLFTO_06410 [Candidatus Acetothermia bacterium]